MKHDPKVGTTDQKPKWEGPPENRPHGYEPAVDNPAKSATLLGTGCPIPTARTFPMRRVSLSMRNERATTDDVPN